MALVYQPLYTEYIKVDIFSPSIFKNMERQSVKKNYDGVTINGRSSIYGIEIDFKIANLWIGEKASHVWSI